jgi:hypothetical protein
MSTQLVGFNDLAYGALYLHLGTWCFTLYDVFVRCMSQIFLSVRTLDKLEMIAVAAGPSFLSSTGETGFQRVAQENPGETVTDALSSSLLIKVVGGLRTLVGAGPIPDFGLSREDLDRWVQAEANAVDSVFSYEGIVVMTSVLSCVGIVVAAYLLHVRLYLGNRLVEQRPEVSLPANCKLPRQYRAKVRLFPAWMWIMLWCVAYATAFAWVRGLPILAGTVVPAATVFLVVYDVLVP